MWCLSMAIQLPPWPPLWQLLPADTCGHIEAGLRTHNIYSPWPEEMNRQITSRIATYNLAPTPLSKENLLKEGVKEETITVTGNTVIDALYLVVDKIKQDASLTGALQEQLKKAGYDPGRLKEGKKLVLITGHRVRTWRWVCEHVQCHKNINGKVSRG